MAPISSFVDLGNNCALVAQPPAEQACRATYVRVCTVMILELKQLSGVESVSALQQLEVRTSGRIACSLLGNSWEGCGTLCLWECDMVQEEVL